MQRAAVNRPVVLFKVDAETPSSLRSLATQKSAVSLEAAISFELRILIVSSLANGGTATNEKVRVRNIGP